MSQENVIILFQILNEKWRFRKNPHNYAMKKTLLMKQKVWYLCIYYRTRTQGAQKVTRTVSNVQRNWIIFSVSQLDKLFLLWVSLNLKWPDQTKTSSSIKRTLQTWLGLKRDLTVLEIQDHKSSPSISYHWQQSFLCVPSVRWHCWLGHLTRKNPSPIWPIMCWWDVKPYSINQSMKLIVEEARL